jgi:hypothetical protein
LDFIQVFGRLATYRDKVVSLCVSCRFNQGNIAFL